MINIANWYSVLHRNDGHPLYLTAFLKRAQYYLDKSQGFTPSSDLVSYFPDFEKGDLAAEGFAAWFWDTFHDRYNIKHLRPHNYKGEYGEFDLNFWVDWGEDGMVQVMGYEPEWPKKPVIYWATDTHVGYDYRLYRAKMSDMVFNSQRTGMEGFIRDGIKDPVYEPPCFDPQAYPRIELSYKKYDIGFVGHVNSQNRIEALDRMFKEFPNFYFGQKLFEEASRKYAESRICFNISWLDDINMRCLEVMGSGNFLLTNDIPALHDFFVSGKHCVMYKSLDEAVELAKYYLEHEDERNAITEAGYEEVNKNHTIGVRVKSIFETLGNRGFIKQAELV